MYLLKWPRLFKPCIALNHYPADKYQEKQLPVIR